MPIKFTQPFTRMPVRFNPEALVAEVKALPKEAWVPHPDGFAGNDAVRLISPDGAATDASTGNMKPTPYLEACPFIQELMRWIGSVWGRSRLMGLAAGSEVPLHIDSQYYWRTHIRIHVPVITNPAVLFTCAGETVHMAPGECWTFDSFMPHDVQNKGSEHRVHLVIDTVGGGRLYDLIEAGTARPDAKPVEFSPGDGDGAPLRLEQVNSPVIMSPWEIASHIAMLREQAVPNPLLGAVVAKLDRFLHEWGSIWAMYGTDPKGIPIYRRLLQIAQQDLTNLRGGGQVSLRNGVPLYYMFERLVFENAIAGTSEPEARKMAS